MLLWSRQRVTVYLPESLTNIAIVFHTGWLVPSIRADCMETAPSHSIYWIRNYMGPRETFFKQRKLLRESTKPISGSDSVKVPPPRWIDNVKTINCEPRIDHVSEWIWLAEAIQRLSNLAAEVWEVKTLKKHDMVKCRRFGSVGGPNLPIQSVCIWRSENETQLLTNCTNNISLLLAL